MMLILMIMHLASGIEQVHLEPAMQARIVSHISLVQDVNDKM